MPVDHAFNVKGVGVVVLGVVTSGIIQKHQLSKFFPDSKLRKFAPSKSTMTNLTLQAKVTELGSH